MNTSVAIANPLVRWDLSQLAPPPSRVEFRQFCHKLSRL